MHRRYFWPSAVAAAVVFLGVGVMAVHDGSDNAAAVRMHGAGSESGVTRIEQSSDDVPSDSGASSTTAPLPARVGQTTTASLPRSQSRYPTGTTTLVGERGRETTTTHPRQWTTVAQFDNSKNALNSGHTQNFQLLAGTGRIVLDKFDWSSMTYDGRPFFSWDLLRGGSFQVASGICSEPHTPSTTSPSPTSTAPGTDSRPRCTPRYEASFDVTPGDYYHVSFSANDGVRFRFEVQEFR